MATEPVNKRFVNRRTVLRGATLAGLTAAIAPTVIGGWQPRPARAARDYTTRETFDAMDKGFNNGDGLKDATNEQRGALAWNEGYVLQGYLLMYEAHRDTYYLDKLIDHLDSVLANRDSERGVKDFAGRSLPGWRAGEPYSVGERVFTDLQGNPILRFRSSRGFGSDCEVRLNTAGEVFSIKTTHFHFSNIIENHTSLTMDPSSSNYVVNKINGAFNPSKLQLTVKDLRENPSGGVELKPEVSRMDSPFYHSPVHVGQIAYPLARFARLVREQDSLGKQYKDKADEYFQAAVDAVGVVDDHYATNDKGEAYELIPRDDPFKLDGADYPFNYAANIGRAYVELAVAGGDAKHKERATAFVKPLVNDLKPNGEGVLWGYYWRGGRCYRGWTAADDVSNNSPRLAAITVPEDVSHGHIDIGLLVAAHEAGIVATKENLASLARTYTRVMLTGSSSAPTVHRNVNGTGATGNESNDLVSSGWLGLAPYDADNRMVQAVSAMFSNYNPEPKALSIFGSGWLNRATKKATSRRGAR